jgi:hypothetical protein
MHKTVPAEHFTKMLNKDFAEIQNRALAESRNKLRRLQRMGAKFEIRDVAKRVNQLNDFSAHEVERVAAGLEALQLANGSKKTRHVIRDAQGLIRLGKLVSRALSTGRPHDQHVRAARRIARRYGCTHRERPRVQPHCARDHLSLYTPFKAVRRTNCGSPACVGISPAVDELNCRCAVIPEGIVRNFHPQVQTWQGESVRMSEPVENQGF